MHAAEIGVAAGRERAQQVERRRRLPVGHQLPLRIGHARLGGEGDVVDDVAAIARQLDAVDLLGRRRARLGELPGDAADLHHRQRAGIGQHHRHLQEHAEEVADVVGAVLGKALGAVAALQQERLARGDARPAPSSGCGPRRQTPAAERSRAAPRRRPGLGIRIFRHLLHRLRAPAIGCPPLGHGRLTPEQKPLRASLSFGGPCRLECGQAKVGLVIHRLRMDR